MVYPPVESGVIVAEETTCDKGTLITTYTRILIPKRKDKDSTLEEFVCSAQSCDSYAVEFRPGADSLEALPFYYPKVRLFLNAHSSGFLDFARPNDSAIL